MLHCPLQRAAHKEHSPAPCWKVCMTQRLAAQATLAAFACPALCASQTAAYHCSICLICVLPVCRGKVPCCPECRRATGAALSDSHGLEMGATGVLTLAALPVQRVMRPCEAAVAGASADL